MEKPTDLVKAYNDAKFDIKKGTDHYKSSILKLHPRVADDYSVKVLVDSLDRAALRVNHEDNYEELQKVVAEVTQRFAYAIGLTRRDREKKEEKIDETVRRGLEYIKAVTVREGSEEGIARSNQRIGELENRLAA